MYHRLCAFLASTYPERWEVALIQHGPSRVYWVFRPGERYPAIVAKVATSAVASETLRREAEALDRLGTTSDSLGIPRLLLAEQAPCGSYLLVQSGVPGSPLVDHVAADDQPVLSRQIAVADRWLGGFQRAVRSPVPLCESLYPWISQCRDALMTPTPAEEALLDAARDALDLLAIRPSTPVHGDFWSGNVLVDGKRISVIDWDRFHFGTPIEDLFNFLSGASFRAFPDPDRSARTLWEPFFGGSRLAQLGARVTRAALDRHGLGAGLIRELFTLFLVTRLATPEFVHHGAWRSFVSSWVMAGLPEPFLECRYVDAESAATSESRGPAAVDRPATASLPVF
jgi:aminoglycoside phosphotransferase